MISLGTVFGQYLDKESPRKGSQARKADQRRAELWGSVLGVDADPHAVSMRQWSLFIVDRGSGTVDARGRRVAAACRKPVRARTVQADCLWLRSVFAWAVRWRLEDGTFLMC